ncbi:hypothetical protein DFH06DRAFT_1150782 [Mycena polygramma]|nr:hypothetical protein DFH06DRAFT_1150782 [Mycena polygramma]
MSNSQSRPGTPIRRLSTPFHYQTPQHGHDYQTPPQHFPYSPPLPPDSPNSWGTVSSPANTLSTPGSPAPAPQESRLPPRPATPFHRGAIRRATYPEHQHSRYQPPLPYSPAWHPNYPTPDAPMPMGTNQVPGGTSLHSHLIHIKYADGREWTYSIQGLRAALQECFEQLPPRCPPKLGVRYCGVPFRGARLDVYKDMVCTIRRPEMEFVIIELQAAEGQDLPRDLKAQIQACNDLPSVLTIYIFNDEGQEVLYEGHSTSVGQQQVFGPEGAGQLSWVIMRRGASEPRAELSQSGVFTEREPILDDETWRLIKRRITHVTGSWILPPREYVNNQLYVLSCIGLHALKILEFPYTPGVTWASS